MEKSRTMTMTKGLSSVGPTAWINGTVMSVQESEQLVRKSEKDCLKSRMKDPLPGLRQVLADLSNNEARTYCRKVRQVAYLLRNTLIDVNTEIRSLTRSKEALEKAKDQIEIDTKKNKISYEIRQKRPDREKVTDNADALLRAEYRHLQDLKKSVEVQQNLIRNHLLTLDEVRRRLTAVSQERSRTLELVADALPRSKGAQQTDEYGGDDILSPDPLGPYTPEADDALDKARAAIDRAKEIKRSADENLARVDEAQKAAIQAVNNCLSQKIRETTMLKNQLTSAVQENRSATNKAQKVFNDTELAWMELRGPVNSRDLSVQEKLDRPIVKVFQRHPGTNLPEAQEMVKGTGELLTSLQCTGQNIGMLKMAEMRLQEDKNNKMAALNVDKQVALMRRKKVIE